MAGTYTPTTEDATGSGKAYYQDVEISPATLKSGALAKRFDTRAYPSLGVTGDSAVGDTAIALAIAPTTPAGEQSFTLTATISGTDTSGNPSGIVEFFDGSTSLGTVAVSANGVAALTVANGLAVGAHSFTAAYGGDENYSAETSSAIAVTFSADVTAPGPVTGVGHTNLAATSLTLNWTNPTDADFAGVMIRRAAGATAPADHTAGTLVSDVAKPGATFGVTGLTTATQYSFALFAHDGSGNYAAGANHTVTTS